MKTDFDVLSQGGSLDFEIVTQGGSLDFEIKNTKTINASGALSEDFVRDIVSEETANLQPKRDENLKTKSKEVVFAINELFDREDKQGLTQEQVKAIVRENAVTKESDPTVPAWAKEPKKPKYKYSEIEGTPNIPSVEGLASEEKVKELVNEVKGIAEEANEHAEEAKRIADTIDEIAGSALSIANNSFEYAQEANTLAKEAKDVASTVENRVEKTVEPNQLYGTDADGNPALYPTDSVGTQVKVDGEKVKEFNADEKFDKTGGIISGNVAIQGNLSVTGTTTTKDTETLLVKDNVIVANADGAELIEDSGFAIKTSTTTAYGIMYDPVGDGVKIGLGSFDENGKFIYEDGQAQFLATRADTITNGNLPKWDDEKKQFVDSGKNIDDIEKAKEIVIVDIMTMIATQNNASFVDLSKRYINGEIAIIGNVIGKNIIVSNIEYAGESEDEYTWTAILSNWEMGENQDLSYANIAVFVIENTNGVLSLGSRTIPVSDFITIDEIRNLPDYFTLTDEEQVRWSDMIGAVAKPTSTSGFNRVYAIQHDSTNTYFVNIMSPAQFANEADAKRRSGLAHYNNGRLGCAPPEKDYESTPRIYVYNLPDYFTPTDDQKAKWRGLIGATKLYLHTMKGEFSENVVYLVSPSNEQILSTTSLYAWLQGKIVLSFTEKNTSSIKLSLVSTGKGFDIVRTYIKSDLTIASEVFIPSSTLTDTVTEL